MQGNTIVTALVAAAGLTSSSHAAIFTGITSLRTAQTAYAPAGGSLVFTGPSDTGFASWFGNSTLFQPGMYAFASQGSELTSTTLSAVGETFVSTATAANRAGARSSIDFIFTLDEAATVTIFAQAGGNFGSRTAMQVYLGTASEAIINASSGFTTFSDVSLAAGTYILSASVLTDVDGVAASANGFYNVSISVPAPGALAAFGLAGLAGTRGRGRR